MMGHHFGVPFHRDLQRRIILDALDFITAAERSGDIKMLPVKWADVRKEGKEIESRLNLRN